MSNLKSVADFEGAWQDAPGVTTGLVERCKRHWYMPIDELPDVMVATYINQKIALEPMKLEARRRIGHGLFDGSELYDGQLSNALETSDS